MSVQLNQSSLTLFSGQTQRLEALGKLDKTDALKVLNDLRKDLVGKPGVLRLLHTSSADKEMKFQRASVFKSWFTSGAKLQRSGEAVADLLRQAGVPDDKVQQFQAQVAQRGTKGIKTLTILNHINELVTADTAEDALAKLGIAVPGQDQFLGKGTYGSAYKVAYNGHTHVLKKFEDMSDAGFDERRILVRDDKHTDAQVKALIAAKRPAETASVMPVVAEDDKVIGPPGPKQFFDIKHSDSDQLSDDSFDVDASKPLLHNSYMDTDSEMSSVSDNDCQAGGAMSLKDLLKIQTRALQKEAWVLEAPQKPKAVPNHPIHGLPLIVEEDDVELQAQPGSAQPNQGLRMGRTAASHALRLNGTPGIVEPSVVLVRERLPEGEQKVHVVPGGPSFKAWLRTKHLEADLAIEAVLMPLAPGKPLTAKDLGRESRLKAQVKAGDLRSLGAEGLRILKGLQARGFIHGDIKPDNMIFSSKQRSLQLIDTDALQKISKKPGTSLPNKPGVHSAFFTHPLRLSNNTCGIGTDLYAFGVTLLETTLLAKGEDDALRTWTRSLTFEPNGAAALTAVRANIKKWREGLAAQARSAKFPPNSPEHFALACIAEALEYEEQRLARKDNTFERYTPDNAKHPLNVLSAHPFITRAAA